MNLGEFRQISSHLPDDSDLILDLGDGDYYEVIRVRHYPPVLEHSYALVVSGGGPITMDLDMHHRDGLDR